MIAGIPADKLIKIHPKMSQQEINKRWAEHFFTPDEEKVISDIESFKERWKKKTGRNIGE